MSSGTSLFFLFLIVNSIGVFVNHIDDTDETYGYWEPLHYLLFGHGMQTWEYAPSFSIRSYAFIMPLFYPLSLAKEYLGLDKIALFFLARLLLGTFFAYAQSRFILSIFNQKQRFPKLLARITCGSILFSPGIFLSSTSFLPSACASALVMLSIASWLNDQYYWSIAWGSVAVVWSGWPFVGLLFLPFGIHMLYDVFASNLRSRSNPSGGSGLSSFFRVMAFCIGSVVVVILVSLPAFAIDHKYYGRW